VKDILETMVQVGMELHSTKICVSWSMTVTHAFLLKSYDECFGKLLEM